MVARELLDHNANTEISTKVFNESDSTHYSVYELVYQEQDQIIHSNDECLC